MNDTETPLPPGGPEPGLPDSVEEQVFQVWFATGDDTRTAAVDEIVARHPEHAAAIRAMCTRLVAGAGVFADLDAAASAEEAPPAIDSYRILDKLGTGGFGVVYLAEQEEPIRRRVALKCLLPGMDSRKVLARFEVERQALALMNHPNIARVFDARGDSAGRPYFVMEYVPGVAITDFCDTRRLSTRARLRLFVDVCMAIQHAHQKGIIHRDIKPSNVLVTEVDDRPVPKIIDFGVAKAIHQPLTMKTLFTEVGRMVGTPAYMSPEQTGATPLDIDTRTDIYSLGVLLYEILTGSLPFSAAELQQQGLDAVRKAIHELEPPRPSRRVSTGDRSSHELAARRHTDVPTLIAELEGDLDWIVLRAIEKDRTRRYPTAQELAADIDRHLTHRPVLARPPKLGYLVGRFVRRYRTQVAAGVLVLLALVAGLVASTAFYLEANAFYVEAQDNLQKYERLSDGVLLGRFTAEAENDLWPEVPDKVPAMESWLRRARSLADRLPLHEESLAAVAARRLPGAAAPVAFADDRDQFLFDALTDMVEVLRAFTHPEHGLIASVARRLERARTLEARTITEHAEAWRACAAAVAADPRFNGLELRPQLGLIPLGKDPTSGMFEFAHLHTGKPAQRTKDGELLSGPECGLVFVLLPGGSFTMGSQRGDPSAPNYAEHATPLEVPVHEVTLQPFLLSKHEVTQATWLRVTGSNPSRFPPSRLPDGKVITAEHPVESVSWTDAARWLRRLGLTFPTEAQWEYACRAGTSSPWNTGDDIPSLQGKLNLCDADSAQYYGGNVERGLTDAWPLHAPVGSFPANAFGLHDTMGNVSEWTRDTFKYYDNPTGPDGERLGDIGARPGRISRGGNYTTTAEYCRCGLRSAHRPDERSPGIGLRPARALAR